jgi:hypothetical protein
MRPIAPDSDPYELAAEKNQQAVIVGKRGAERLPSQIMNLNLAPRCRRRYLLLAATAQKRAGPHAPRGCCSQPFASSAKETCLCGFLRLARTLVRLACTWLRFEGTFMPFIRRLGEHYFAENASLQWR